MPFCGPASGVQHMGLFKRTRRKRSRKPAKTMQRRLNLEILEDRTLLSVNPVDVAGVPQWTEEGPSLLYNGSSQLGPAPGNDLVIGSVQALAVSPADPNTILAGATSG